SCIKKNVCTLLTSLATAHYDYHCPPRTKIEFTKRKVKVKGNLFTLTRLVCAHASQHVVLLSSYLQSGHVCLGNQEAGRAGVAAAPTRPPARYRSFPCLPAGDASYRTAMSFLFLWQPRGRESKRRRGTAPAPG
ncbi:unnamed protein product, partial [Heterosigma akashiwo]